jgi:hypothetical protein
MAVMIFWKDATGGKPKKKGVKGGAMWDQFIVNARAGYGEAYFVECNSAEEGRAMIARGDCKPVTGKPNVYANCPI